MNGQVSFSEIERQSKIAHEAGDLNRLQGILLPLLREDDRTRSASQNLFIYRTLGAIYDEQGHHEDSLMAYRQAHGYDARDFETLSALSEEALKHLDDGHLQHVMELLVFHRNMLKPVTVMKIFKALGDMHAQRGESSQARDCYEKALEERPGDMDLINALLDVSRASGDEGAIKASREKLLDSLSDSASRAAVLVSIGDDYMNAQNEPQALAMYEEALSECAQSAAALGRILVIAERAQDWERALDALSALVKCSADDDERCKYLLKEAWIFKEKLDNQRRALEIFNEVLDIRPDQLEVFQGIVSMLMAQNNFSGMEENFVRMIDRQRGEASPNPKVMAVLWKNLGELRLKHLRDLRGAAQAYHEASALYPDNVSFHLILAKIYEQLDDMQAQAVHENREILRLAPDKLEAVSALARCYRRMEKYDEALCIYRVLDVLGMSDEAGREIVTKFSEGEIGRINECLNETHWQLVRPKTFDMSIARILQCVVPHISRMFDRGFEYYEGLHEKEAHLDVRQDTVFIRAIRSETKALGFSELPEMYRYGGIRGVKNAYLGSSTFLVNPDILMGRSNSEIAFLTAKAMLLMRPEFYLLGYSDMTAIELLLRAVFKTVCPSLNIELDKNQQRVSRTLERELSSAEHSLLNNLIHEISKRGGSLDVRLFMESVEDYANRIGLLFCDDPSVINKLLTQDDSHGLSRRSVSDRVGSLLVWALSEEYAKLRKMLGLSISR